MKNKVEKIASALLYEGYLLYPYRKSALKNAQRFNFGLLEPQDFFQTEVLVSGAAANFAVEVRFLQIQQRQVLDEKGEKRDGLEIDGQIFETWDEAVERRIETARTAGFEFASETFVEDLAGGKAKYVRRSGEICGRLEIKNELLRKNLQRVTVKIRNLSRAEKFISTHLVLTVENAVFISLLEFAAEFEKDVKSLNQTGLFPVLIEQNVMLASPIILYDFPQVATESRGDFYDATEIDELLTLRILTMTAAEKREAAMLDPRAAKILEQAENTPLMDLHGKFRSEKNLPAIGQKVRLKPKKSADTFDLFLKDQIAVIKSVEEDLEGRAYFSVILENDEGHDFGFDKFIGHQFFFSADELEIVS